MANATVSTGVLRVLWIDDEVDPGDSTVRLLRDEAIAIEVAPTAAQGLSQAVEMRHDVILLDVRLPDMYGVHTLAHLRAMGVGCPIVMATGHYLQPEVEADARRLGAADFLYKPFLDLAGLARVLRVAAVTGAGGHEAAIPEPVHGIVAASRAMREVLAWVERTAPGTRKGS